jgi:hypothetical protein
MKGGRDRGGGGRERQTDRQYATLSSEYQFINRIVAVNISNKITYNIFRTFYFPLGNGEPGVATSCHTV